MSFTPALIPLLAAGGAGGGGEYYISLIGTSGTDGGVGCALDSEGNLIVAGSGPGVIGSTDGYVIKLDPNGTLLWAKAVGFTSQSTTLGGVAVDSNDDVIVSGRNSEPGFGSADGLLIKLAADDGDLLWRREFGSSTADTIGDVALDGADNVFVGTHNGAKATILKWASDGTFAWQQKLTVASIASIACGADAAGNSYLGVRVSANPTLAKYNAAGVLQWQHTLTGVNSINWIDADGSGNIYVTGLDAGSPSVAYAIKLSSTPTVTWARTIVTNHNLGGTGFLDASGNVYMASYVDTTLDEGLLAKWNNGGVIQLRKRLFATTSGLTNFAYVVADADGDIKAVGTTSADGAGGNDIVVLSLPADGSGDGIYGGLELDDSTATEASLSLTIGAGSLTSAAGDLSQASGNTMVADLTTLTFEQFPLIV
jgi:hypothetical protein